MNLPSGPTDLKVYTSGFSYPHLINVIDYFLSYTDLVVSGHSSNCLLNVILKLWVW